MVSARPETPTVPGVPSPVPCSEEAPAPQHVLHPAEPLTREQIERVRSRIDIRPPMVNLPRRLRGRLAALLLALFQDLQETPPLAYLWALVTAGNVRPAVLQYRLALAETGRYRTLLADHGARPKCVQTPSKVPRDLRAARTFMAHGELKKAARAVHPRGAFRAPTAADVEEKFPPAGDAIVIPRPTWPGTTPAQVRIQLDAEKHGDGSLRTWREAILDAVRLTEYSSAPGPDAIRSSHLRQLLVVRSVGGQLGDRLAQLTDRYVRGAAHACLDDVSLSMVPKESGGFRPIGVGSLLRRLPLRIVARRLRADLRRLLETHGQLGLADAGPQRAYLRAQRHVRARFATLRLDVANAFNEATRGALMGAAQRVGDKLWACGAPSAALVAACAVYERPTRVYVSGSHSFVSERGVVQGCPLGTALFSVLTVDILSSLQRVVDLQAAERGLPADETPTVGPMASEAQELSHDPRRVHYVMLHDDITLSTSSSQNLPVVVAALQALMADAGLSLARGKSVIIADRAIRPDTLQVLEARQAEAAMFAGAPLYSSAGETEANDLVLNKADRAMAEFEHVGRMRDPQDLVKLACAAGCWSRLQYLHSLTAHMPAWKDLLPRADRLSQSILGKALGAHACSPGPWPSCPPPRGVSGSAPASWRPSPARAGRSLPWTPWRTGERGQPPYRPAPHEGGNACWVTSPALSGRLSWANQHHLSA